MKPRLYAKILNEIATLPPSSAAPYNEISNLIKQCPSIPTQFPDKFAYDVVSNALRNSANQSDQVASDILKAVFDTLYALESQLASKDYEAISSSTIPCFNGFLRALEGSCVRISPQELDVTLERIKQFIKEHTLDAINENINTINTDEEYGKIKRRMTKYWDKSSFSSDVVIVRLLKFMRNCLAKHIEPTDRSSRENYPESSESPVLPYTPLTPGFPATALPGSLVIPSRTSSLSTKRSDFHTIWQWILNHSTQSKFENVNNDQTTKTLLKALLELANRYFREKKDYITANQGSKDNDADQSSAALMAVSLQLSTLCVYHLQESNQAESHVQKLIGILRDPSLSSCNSGAEVHIAALDSISLLSRVLPQSTIQSNVIPVLQEYLINPNSMFITQQTLIASFYELVPEASNSPHFRPLKKKEEHKNTLSRLRKSAADAFAKCIKPPHVLSSYQRTSSAGSNSTLRSIAHRVTFSGEKGRRQSTDDEDTGAIPPPLFALINSIYRYENEEVISDRLKAQLVFDNAIQAIGSVTCLMQSFKISEMTVSTFMRRLQNPLSSVNDSVIIRVLSDIAESTSDIRVFSEIIGFFGTIYKILKSSSANALSPPAIPYSLPSAASLDGALAASGTVRGGKDMGQKDLSRLSTVVLDSFGRLSKSVDGEFKKKLLFGVMSTFVDKALLIQAEVGKGKGSEISDLHTPSFEDLGNLLPLLSRLASLPKNPSEDEISLYRNVWFFIVLFDLHSSTSFAERWKEHIRKLAVNSPVLLTWKTVKGLDSDAELNSVLTGGWAESILARNRQFLSKVIPNTPEIQNLTLPAAIFLVSIYHVESHKVNEHIYGMLPYVSNDSRQNPDLSKCIEVLVNSIFARFIAVSTSSLTSIPNAPSSPSTSSPSSSTVSPATAQSNILKTALGLIYGVPHRIQKIHHFAIDALEKVLSVHTNLLFNPVLIPHMLDLLNLLKLAATNVDGEEYEPVYEFELIPTVPSSFSSSSGASLGSPAQDKITITLPDDTEYRKSVYDKLSAFVDKWLSVAVERNSNDIIAVLQGFIFLCKNRIKIGLGGHAGVNMAVKVLGKFDDSLETLIFNLAQRSLYAGASTSMASTKAGVSPLQIDTDVVDARAITRSEVLQYLDRLKRGMAIDKEEGLILYEEMVYKALWLMLDLSQPDDDLIRFLVWAPIYFFTPSAMSLSLQTWSTYLTYHPQSEPRVLLELARSWKHLIRHQKSLFNVSMMSRNPFTEKMTYSGSKSSFKGLALFRKDLTILELLLRWFNDKYEQTRNLRNKEFTNWLFSILFESCDEKILSTHPLSRSTRFKLLSLGLKISTSVNVEDEVVVLMFRNRLFTAALSWFKMAPVWSSCRTKQQIVDEIKALVLFWSIMKQDRNAEKGRPLSAKEGTLSIAGSLANGPEVGELSEGMKVHAGALQKRRDLLQLLLAHEMVRLSTWFDPFSPNSLRLSDEVMATYNQSVSNVSWKQHVRTAWDLSPALAVHLFTRFNVDAIKSELQTLVLQRTKEAMSCPEAVQFLVTEENITKDAPELKYLPTWSPIPPIQAINYFSPAYKSHPVVIQYAMRSLFSYPLDLTFFYIPQVVQTLRFDKSGFAEDFIVRAAKTSQVFAHQIIWNMNANMYKDEEGTEPDQLKPVFDRIIDKIVSSLSGADKDFYEREFTFFNKVTSISGKLKPYIKKPKAEKKKKIDEELRQITVDVGVYLPSNPESTVVGIDYDSGRPLQSHAKAPFLATFKIQRQIQDSDGDEESKKKKATEEIWQSAIFKVGDDCRQDVLALQLIAVFKNIFANVGLDLYLFPYRVVATAPGCGVIEVIPNSTSRDIIGRERINNLFEYFIAKYGPPETISFQKARNNFVQSLAAYSVILYLLQIKDRHNGNIMFDDEGRVIHIDFGFILDISPGGIGFESAPFKLTTEMIQVLGGGNTAIYKRFCELCVKAYLAVRPYATEICQLVELMLESGLPCFKGESTIRKLKSRFQLEKSEYDAAQFMNDRVYESFENKRTVLYDEFQKQTNGIPY
ncbi:hypothetical protein BKA69DRAFT_1069366 [Paraphysoderma sedebokerense]|nr:hypothetical protein BKA69DRAFT_1069366 [Paraphysoderma sedebokerense]